MVGHAFVLVSAQQRRFEGSDDVPGTHPVGYCHRPVTCAIYLIVKVFAEGQAM